jgi:hypothetical protein
VATLKDTLRGDFSDLEALLSTWLEALAKRIMEAQGVIGHIKASLSADDNVSTFSTTDGIVHTTYVSRSLGGDNTQPSGQQEAELTLVAIILNVDGNLLRQMIIDTRP